MRIKTRASRPRLSISPLKPSSWLHSPLHFQVEANAEENVIIDLVEPGTVDGETGCDSDDEKKTHDSDRMDGDWLEGGICIECNNRGDGLVLFCTEIGCPIGVHENCLKFKPKFDDSGNFYCPYCWYKRELARALELREEARLAREALSEFVSFKRVGGDGDKKNKKKGSFEGNAQNVRSRLGMRNHGEDSTGMEVDDGGGGKKEFVIVGRDQNEKERVEVAENEMDLLHPVVDESDKGNHSQLEKGVDVTSIDDSMIEGNKNVENISKKLEIEVEDEEDNENVDNGQEEGIVEEGEKVEPLNVRCVLEETNADNIPHRSGEVKSDAMKASEDGQGMWGGGQLINQCISETNVIPTREVSVPMVDEMSDLDDEPLALRKRHRMHVKQSSKKVAQPKKADSPAQPEKADSPAEPKKADSPKKSSPYPHISKKKAVNHKITASPSKKSTKPQESASSFTNLTFATEKRKRLHWKPEEEEMLKEGVHKFSSTANKNIPWRKILEFGRHVFDATRNPIDLKDKWRNLMAKES